jgi:hypothetical protein
MAGDPGWRWYSDFLAKHGIPAWWSRVVLVSLPLLAVVAAAASLHGPALAAWCFGGALLIGFVLPLGLPRWRKARNDGDG